MKNKQRIELNDSDKAVIRKGVAAALNAKGNGRTYGLDGLPLAGEASPGFVSMPTTQPGHWENGSAWQGHRVYVDGPRVGTVAVPNDAMLALHPAVPMFGLTKHV